MSDTTKKADTSTASTKDLKRVLTLGDLLGTAVGQIIGAGIMTLTGIAISMTGRSVPLAFLVSAVLVLVSVIPTVIISGTIRMRGGQYTLMGMLAGQKFAGMFVLMFILQQVSIATYSLSFAQYFCSFIPALNGNAFAERVVALCILTLFYVINLVGVDKAAKAQNIIVIFMIIALGTFVGFGLPKVQPDYLTAPGFFSNGAIGLLTAGSLLTVATSGGQNIVNLGAESKNATRDIPLAIIISTSVVAVMYAFIAVVASGVLPVSEVSGQPLSLVAKEIMPTPLYVFFMVGGAMFALISTLNAQMQWATKPVLQACVDGWLPVKLAKLNKAKTPVYLLTILYFVGVIPIVCGINISTLANMVVIIVAVFGMILNFNLHKMPKLVPEEWAKSKFKVSKTWITIITVLTMITGALTVVLQLIQLSVPMMIANVVLFAAAYFYASYRSKSGKVHMEISYESN